MDGPTEPVQSAPDSSPENRASALVKGPSYEAIVQMEMSRKAMMDNYLEHGALSVDALFEKFAQLTTLTHDLFSYHYQMVEFLCIRSHLYAVDFKAETVSRRPTDYRRAMLKLLECCCQRDSCSVEGLRQFILGSVDNSFAPIVAVPLV